eukprot:gene729-2149_t
MASEGEEHPSEFDGHTSRLRCQRRSENQAREEDSDPRAIRAAFELMKALQQQNDKQQEELMKALQQQNDKQEEERARWQQELEARLTAHQQNDKQQEELMKTPEGGGTPPTTFDVWMDMIRKDDGHKELQRYFTAGSNGNLYVPLLALSVYHADTDWSLGMMRKYGYDSISGHQHLRWTCAFGHVPCR